MPTCKQCGKGIDINNDLFDRITEGSYIATDPQTGKTEIRPIINCYHRNCENTIAIRFERHLSGKCVIEKKV